MQPIIEEVVNLTMWTVAVGSLSLAAGARIGSKIQRWMSTDEKIDWEQGFNDGRDSMLTELFETSEPVNPYGVNPDQGQLVLSTETPEEACYRNWQERNF